MKPNTIVALSSGSGPSGVAVIRASGPDVRFGLEAVCGRIPQARVATLASLRDETGAVIDHGLILFFAAPASFTGEDVAEFQVHGGTAVVRDLLDRLTDLPGWRLAERGEFSRRAVENGRLDLTRAEAIADLISAETSAQRRQAVQGLQGELERRSIRWRNDIADIAALVEAEIDFPYEDDVPELLGRARSQAQRLVTEIGEALRGARSGERLRLGATIVLAGRPNAGKSTLLNALARRDVAIVSPIAGTTRDALEVRLELGGFPVTLVDTAGLRATEDPIEALGVERTRSRIEEADLVLWLVPVGADASDAPPGSLIVWTKADLQESADGGELISAVTGFGLDRLLKRLESVAATALAGGEAALVTRLRHRLELERARDALQTFGDMAVDSAPELLAEELRVAMLALGRLTGRIDIDELYDRIFRDFCIGK